MMDAPYLPDQLASATGTEHSLSGQIGLVVVVLFLWMQQDGEGMEHEED